MILGNIIYDVISRGFQLRTTVAYVTYYGTVRARFLRSYFLPCIMFWLSIKKTFMWYCIILKEIRTSSGGLGIDWTHRGPQIQSWQVSVTWHRVWGLVGLNLPCVLLVLQACGLCLWSCPGISEFRGFESHPGEPFVKGNSAWLKLEM